MVSPIRALIISVRTLTEKWTGSFHGLLPFLTAVLPIRSRSFPRQVRRTLGTATAVLLGLVAAPQLLTAQDVNIQQGPGGIAIGGKKNARTTGFGTVNGLGIGTPVAGATVIPAAGGVLYSSPINLMVNGAGAGNPAVVGVYVSNNFAHPAMLQAFSCITGCTSAANYTAISLNSASPTPVIPSPGLTTNPTITVYIAVFVSNQDGASAFAGTESAQLVYDSFNGATNQLKNTDTLTLNNPLETLETAVQLTLGTATGGLTISPSADYAANYGNVNGLGIGPGAGLTTVAVAGGTIYSTPYLINPAFSDFSSTTATIKVALTSNFAHPTVLQLDDSGSSSGPFTQITAASLQITGSAGSLNPITRYLGLFVSGTNNGPGAFAGSDTATLTFTMTVP